MDESESTYNRIHETIRKIWHRLTDDEVNAFDEARDIFFLAVRKKHGVARAQAQLFLTDLEQGFGDVA